MNIILISLFTSLILHGHVNIGFRYRLLVSKITKKPMEQLITKDYKMLDCFQCLSFWIAVLVAIISLGPSATPEALTQIDWQQVCATFVIASFYDNLILRWIEKNIKLLRNKITGK